eukprot:CAMPEP_0173379080 /NCGR_PEP_ID=MMETSP1356-20130122/2153_1 /TAXON_ID=77927 ORGANISM="Hemiselmis virescens, Strain PCC157" /NCGR_SAMPLE_ID=MMETSP1356 /ASSEMBLY_ACC=CAM_ASM_000847 /LENGTH=64 /DNA_ID=CAMNT_0014332349 /DNA_START=172 /DNA_END=362 /DNA_ORIENTATION=+
MSSIVVVVYQAALPVPFAVLKTTVAAFSTPFRALATAAMLLTGGTEDTSHRAPHARATRPDISP